MSPALKQKLGSPFFFIAFGAWQVIVFATPLSLYGFWTDILAFLLWVLYLIIRPGITQRWMKMTSTAVLICVIGFGILTISTLVGAFMAVEIAMTMTVPQDEKLKGVLLTNQYFQPTGAYGCGYGALTTAKAFVLFPIIEYRTGHDPCVHDDYGCFIERGSWEACGY
ncbi:MAG: hypothetical protein WAT74_10525 [Flavobacteriales bacterium]